jgi:hypothetical protein
MAHRNQRSNRPPAPNPIIFRRTDALGTAAAEHDELLQNCFVDAGYLTRLADTSAASPCIVLGRTGSGKSALLLEFERHHGAIRLAPEALALNHISQSTIIGILSALGVKLAPFYKLLWRHFFCINALAARFKSMSAFESWFSGLNPNARRGRKYLEEWAGKDFFQNARTVSTQLTQTLESKVNAGLKGKGFELGAVDGLTTQQRQEIVPVCQDIITSDLAEQLQAVMHVTRQLFQDIEPIYFVIDGLDEDWVQEDQRYLLIMGLIQTLSDFRDIPNAKILAALRRDLLEEVYAQARPPGFQEEKLQDMYLHVEWTEDDLTAVLDRRIDATLRSRYAKSVHIGHKDVFPQIMRMDGEKSRTIEYLLSRTHMRPRDLITFANHIIKQSKTGHITIARIREAEKKYSDDRLRSVADEWHVQEPGLNDLARLLLRDQLSRFSLGDLQESRIRDKATSYAMRDEVRSMLIRDFANGVVSFQNLITQGIQRLYRYGVVRLKPRPNETFRCGLDEDAPSEIDDLDLDARIEIHPMFWQALNTRRAAPGLDN